MEVHARRVHHEHTRERHRPREHYGEHMGARPWRWAAERRPELVDEEERCECEEEYVPGDVVSFAQARRAFPCTVRGEQERGREERGVCLGGEPRARDAVFGGDHDGCARGEVQRAFAARGDDEAVEHGGPEEPGGEGEPDGGRERKLGEPDACARGG